MKAMELGYTGITYNRTIKGVMSDRDRCSISLLILSSLLKLAPSLSCSVNLHLSLLGIPRASPFRQYMRLTVCIKNPSQDQAFNSKNPACLANRFLFLFFKIVFENKNKKPFSVVFSLKKCLANCFRKQFLKTENTT
jgi:hypothetical protein